MTLYMIGLGLYDAKDITIRAKEAISQCDQVFLESYTSRLHCSHEELEAALGTSITKAPREMVEKEAETILGPAKEKNVAFLVVGDVFSATTHTDFLLRARELGIKVEVIHNTSILTAIGITGLELYKFGKTTSIVFSEEHWLPDTPYVVTKNNLSLGLHTLLLLDIKEAEASAEDIRKGKENFLPPRHMTVNQALGEMLKLEEKHKEGIVTEDTVVIGCARLGAPDFHIKVGKVKDLLNYDFGPPLHSIIIPGKLHFLEEEALKYYE